MANTKLPSRLLDTSAIPALNVTGDLTVDTTTLKVDSTNNRVGIGIASPDHQLDVEGGNNVFDLARFGSSASDNSEVTIGYFDATANNGIPALITGSDFGGLIQGGENGHLVLGIRDNDTTDALDIVSGGGNFMTDSTYDTLIASFKANGNVGIGTASPASLLSIQGDGIVLRMDGTANASRTLLFRNVGTAEGIIRTDGNMHFLQEDASRYMRFSTANTERMRIDATGNVTINSSGTIPTGVLLGRQLVVGSSTGSEVIAFREDTSVAVGDKVGAFLISNSDTDGAEDHFVGMWGKVSSTNGSQNLHFAAGRSGYEGDSPQMTLDSSGNVKIGNTSGSGILNVDNGANDGGYVHFANNVGSTTLTNDKGLAFGWNKSNAGGESIIIANQGPGSTGGLVFATNTSSGSYAERMLIDNTGRVGINRTPAISNSKLEVGGADNVPLINVEASGATAGVGIGSSRMKFYYGTSEKMSLDSVGNLRTSRQVIQENSDGTPRFINIPYSSAGSGFTFNWDDLANHSAVGDQASETNAFMFEVNVTSYLFRRVKALIIVDTNSTNSIAVHTIHSSTLTCSASIPTNSEQITITIGGLWGNAVNYMGRITTF